MLLYRQLRDAGYKGPFGAGDAVASVLTFVEPVGAQAAEGVYFVGCPLTLPDDFRADFKKVHGSEPRGVRLHGPVRGRGDGLARRGGRGRGGAERRFAGDRPAALRDAVRATDSHGRRVRAHLAFDDYGDRISAASDLTEQAKDLGLAACQVQDGKLVNLFP